MNKVSYQAIKIVPVRCLKLYISPKNIDFQMLGSVWLYKLRIFLTDEPTTQATTQPTTTTTTQPTTTSKCTDHNDCGGIRSETPICDDATKICVGCSVGIFDMYLSFFNGILSRTELLTVCHFFNFYYQIINLEMELKKVTVMSYIYLLITPAIQLELVLFA